MKGQDSQLVGEGFHEVYDMHHLVGLERCLGAQIDTADTDSNRSNPKKVSLCIRRADSCLSCRT